MHLSTTSGGGLFDVRSKSVVLLLIYCLMFLPLVCECSLVGLYFVIIRPPDKSA